MNFHFAEVPTNALTGSAYDPITKTPDFKVTAVKVTRVAEEANV
jgi:predicted molibdopterin-dependent oxidoreductase YjgC